MDIVFSIANDKDTLQRGNADVTLFMKKETLF